MIILFNARIHTLNHANPSADTVVIDRGNVVAVGGRGLLDEFALAKKKDMQGKVILPGLIDAHMHLLLYALNLSTVDCEVDSKAECLRRVQERVRNSSAKAWVRGHGWNQHDWDGGWPSAAELDSFAPDVPVYLTAKSLHAGWANSAALRIAGIDASTPDPVNGRIVRDEHGQPTGVLLEDAMHLLAAAIPEPSLDEAVSAFRSAQSKLLQMGLTGIHDFDPPVMFQALQFLHERGELSLRIVKSIRLADLPNAVALGLRTGFGDERLQIGSVKIFSDGALGPHTAAMLEPYVDSAENRGILNLDSEELFEHGRLAAKSGLSLAVHAIGDRANHEVLNGLGQLREYESKNGMPSLRHRIEHVQLLHPDDAGRLAELNIVASMQPVHVVSDMHMADTYWGARAAHAYAWRTQVRHGARLAFGSDAPVESPNPFWGLHAAVTRCRRDGVSNLEGWYPEQRLTLMEAFQGFTHGPAYAAGMEGRLGSLVEGYHADLIVLEDDPFQAHPQELWKLHPVATMIAGEWVWEADG
ncbi:MAG: amidohydrolase [Chloroflexota bacterium]